MYKHNKNRLVNGETEHQVVKNENVKISTVRKQDCEETIQFQHLIGSFEQQPDLFDFNTNWREQMFIHNLIVSQRDKTPRWI